jgi:hypothetical protein
VKLPREGDSPLTWLLFKQSGVISYAQALQHMSPGAIRHKLDRGRWQRIFRGVILTTPGRMTAVQQWQAAVLAAPEGAVLAGLAAAQAGGLRGKFGRAVIDILAPAEAHFRPFPKALLLEMIVVKVHRTTLLDQIHIHNGQPPHTIMPRSIVDAAQWALSDDEAQLIVASACQQRLVLRQNEVWLEGDRVLRFPAHLLRARPELVLEQLRRALTGR